MSLRANSFDTANTPAIVADTNRAMGKIILPIDRSFPQYHCETFLFIAPWPLPEAFAGLPTQQRVVPANAA